MTYRNLVEIHRRQAERLGCRPALRARRHGVYRDLSMEQYRADALACAAALVRAGIKSGDGVGLLSENRLEWLIADMAILTAGAYGAVMASAYNARPPAPEVLVKGDQWSVVRPRMDDDALIAADRIPAWLE